jgi:hypothetical protein
VPPDGREVVESLGIPVTPVGPEVSRSLRPSDGREAAEITTWVAKQFGDSLRLRGLIAGAAVAG